MDQPGAPDPAGDPGTPAILPAALRPDRSTSPLHRLVHADLADHVLRPVPIRQWVLSLPWHLRFAMAGNPKRLRNVASAFIRAVSAFYGRRVRQELEDKIATPCAASTVLSALPAAASRAGATRPWASVLGPWQFQIPLR